MRLNCRLHFLGFEPVRLGLPADFDAAFEALRAELLRVFGLGALRVEPELRPAAFFRAPFGLSFLTCPVLVSERFPEGRGLSPAGCPESAPPESAAVFFLCALGPAPGSPEALRFRAGRADASLRDPATDCSRVSCSVSV
ncbi:MAG: hypothetical protein LAT75_09385, partial [Candidatus Cyclonatronum sp.]|uniref:hypothetical protein n=1 Tax=Cyclonatronum sp. TaxID=3024185 RepID=UPI0025C1DCFC